MGLFSKRASNDPGNDPGGGRHVRVAGLVTAANAPPQGAPSYGANSRGTIQVLIDDPVAGRRRQLAAAFKFAGRHWVVPGMEVPVFLDPASPDTFEVDWQAVPAMQEQAEANHPALADPFAAARQVAESIGIRPSEKTAARYERFRQAVAEASQQPAPPGRLRAVALAVTIRGRYHSGESNAGGSGGFVSLPSSSAAVLSVTVPGRPPYAVYLPRFSYPRKHLSLPGEALPALVSAADPRDVEIRWDEMTPLGDQIAGRMADSARASNQLIAALSEQIQAATAQATAPAKPGAPEDHQPDVSTAANPAGMPAPAAGLPPQARQIMIENLRRSLQYVTSPRQRQMMLDQYRAMGIDLTPEELGF